jgi:hypothetical protein
MQRIRYISESLDAWGVGGDWSQTGSETNAHAVFCFFSGQISCEAQAVGSRREAWELGP